MFAFKISVVRRTTLVGVTSVGVVFALYNNDIMLGTCQRANEQRVQHQALDKVMKRLGIKLAHDGENPTPIVHCDASKETI
jgi:hypothetical protein